MIRHFVIIFIPCQEWHDCSHLETNKQMNKQWKNQEPRRGLTEKKPATRERRELRKSKSMGFIASLTLKIHSRATFTEKQWAFLLCILIIMQL